MENLSKKQKKLIIKGKYTLLTEKVNLKEKYENRLNRFKETQKRQLEKFNIENKRKKGVTEKRKNFIEKQKKQYLEREARYISELESKIIEYEEKFKIYKIGVELGNDTTFKIEKQEDTKYRQVKRSLTYFINTLQDGIGDILRKDEYDLLIADLREFRDLLSAQKINNDEHFYKKFKALDVTRIGDSDVIISISNEVDESIYFPDLRERILDKMNRLYGDWLT